VHGVQDDNRAGERVAVDQRKKNSADFALWKVRHESSSPARFENTRTGDGIAADASLSCDATLDSRRGSRLICVG